MNKIQFNPTISIDGVAVISAAVFCALWFGALSQRVNEHERMLTRHEETMRTLANTLQLQQQNIAVLQTIVSNKMPPDNKK